MNQNVKYKNHQIFLLLKKLINYKLYHYKLYHYKQVLLIFLHHLHNTKENHYYLLYLILHEILEYYKKYIIFLI